jgi:hypothetical protein
MIVLPRPLLLLLLLGLVMLAHALLGSGPEFEEGVPSLVRVFVCDLLLSLKAWLRGC